MTTIQEERSLKELISSYFLVKINSMVFCSLDSFKGSVES